MNQPLSDSCFRYKVTIEYCGTNYHGMQKQTNLRTVESSLLLALSRLTNSAVIDLVFAGRTDAGVHAAGQVFHFDSVKRFTAHQVKAGLNYYLTNDEIVVVDAEEADLTFHARFSAIQRVYIYKILNRTDRPTFQKNLLHHCKHSLDIENMRSASLFLIGKHDFTAFRSSECQKSPIKTIDFIEIYKTSDDVIEIKIGAKSFLHNMIRIIAGVLIEVGRGKISPEQIPMLLQRKDRSGTPYTASACGLYFKEVVYLLKQ